MLGTYSVIVTDENNCQGNSAEVTVSEQDLEDPNITSPNDISVSNEIDQCGANVSYSAVVTDDCGVASVVYSPPSGSFFTVGTTAVSIEATDVFGNVSNCSFNVTVIDDQLPEISCPSDIEQSNTINQCSAIVDYEEPVANDNCPNVMVELQSGFAPESTFPVGTTAVVYKAIDDTGNENTCSFNVTVIDDQLPEISCPTDIEQFKCY